MNSRRCMSSRLLASLAFLLVVPVCALHAELSITNAMAVNVSPSEFAVFFRTSEPANSSISVFANSGGSVSLQGQLGVESCPVQTGDPVSTNRYEYRASRERLRSDMMGKGLHLFRVSGCRPECTYYFRITAHTNGGSSVYWPAGGVLATARTAAVNSFVPDSRQLVVEVPGISVRGNVGVLEHAAAAYPIAAVVGDAAGHNQLYFNLSDLFSAADGRNLVFNGQERFAITVYGAYRHADTSRDYSLALGNTTVVAQADAMIADAGYLLVDVGETNVLSSVGHSFVPISVISSPQAETINLQLTMNGGVFTNLLVSPRDARVGSAVMTSVGEDRYHVTITAAPGQTIHHTTLQEAELVHLEFWMDPLQRTVSVPVSVSSIEVTDTTNRVFSTGVLRNGSILVIGRNPFLSWDNMSDTLKSFDLHGVPGTNYVVEYSTDLRSGTWSNWFGVSMGATNLTTTVDLPPTNAPVLFLRVRERP